MACLVEEHVGSLDVAVHHAIVVQIGDAGCDLRDGQAKERYPAGSLAWAEVTAQAFSSLVQEECAEVAKPEWWSDEGLKALSARVVRAAPDDSEANQMRAVVLLGQHHAWDAGPRSAEELRQAATHYDRAAALCPAPAVKAGLAENAAWCRRWAGGCL